MLRSMTGFGKAQWKNKEERIYFEIKGSNHKFLEVFFNLPEGFTYLESLLKKEIEKKIKRGRVMVFLEITSPGFNQLFLNKELLRKYFFLLEDLRKELSIEEKPKLETLINLGGVLSRNNPIKDKAQELRIKRTFGWALERFLKHRESLGEAIYKELKRGCGVLKETLQHLKKRAEKAIKDKAKEIKNPEEKINFLNSRDITEEINLLKFLISNLETKLDKDSAGGKELDFIIQEMQREINTLSAKSFDPKVITYSIKIKTQIERMREQVQNVE